MARLSESEFITTLNQYHYLALTPIFQSYGTLISASSGTASVTPAFYTHPTQLKAVAFKSGYTASAVHGESYSVGDDPSSDPCYPVAYFGCDQGGGTNSAMRVANERRMESTMDKSDSVDDNSVELSTAVISDPPIAVYLYAGDQIVENVTTGYLYFQDSLGNTSHVTDAAGNLLESYTYDAFGTPTFLSTNNTQLSTSAYGIKHLFQGQLWTQETGLNHYRNRVELPTMGVFLQPDPIGFKGDAANVYRFCNNNAVNRVDPMGLYVVVDLTNASRCFSAPNPEAPPEIVVAGTNIAGDVARFEDRMNSAKRPGSKIVNWSVGFQEVWDRKYTFRKCEVAVTDWRVVSTAFEKDGRIVGFHNTLLITIHWNDAASQFGKDYARRSIGGEIEHTLDAMRAGYFADGQGHVNFSSAQNIADRTAGDLVGTTM